MLLETVLPGMIAGILGGLCLLAAVLTSYAKFDVGTANMVFLGVMAGVVAGAWLWLKYFPDSPMAMKFVSHRQIGDIGAEQPELLDQVGVAHTTLRPCGTAVIGGKRVDVISEGALVDRGQRIKVVAVEGLRVVVRPV